MARRTRCNEEVPGGPASSDGKPGAASGMPKVFAAFKALGAELLHASIPAGVSAPSLDWRVEAVESVSASTSARGRGLVARGWLLPGTTCACPAIFFLQ